MGKKSRLKKLRRNSKTPSPAKTSGVSRTGLAACLAILLLAGFLVYCQSLNNDFVNLDDNEHVYENEDIRQLDGLHITRMFTGSRMGNWIPLTQLSFAIDYQIWGMNPWGFHLSSLILHLLNILLVFWLIWLLTSNWQISFISTLFFALSPLHVESVAWITERKDLLYAFFYLLAFICWIKIRNKSISYLLCCLFFVLALLAKSMAVSLPVLLILYDLYYQKMHFRKTLLNKFPLFFLAAATAYITWRSTYSETSTYAELNVFERLLTANYAFWFYPLKLLLPLNLSAIYPYPEGINNALPLYYYLLPLLTITLALYLYKFRQKLKAVNFWLWFYLLSILPVLQLVPLAGSSLTCDRFTYLPSIGIYMILLLALWRIFEPVDLDKLHWQKHLPKPLLIIFLLINLLFGILSWQRSLVWKDGISLHSDIIKKYPQVELAWINRGKAYSLRGEHGRAIADFSEAIKVSPASADAYNNRGNEYGEIKKWQKALADLNQAIQLRPDFARAYSNRAHIYMESSRYDQAAQDFEQALKLNPDFPGAWFNRGNLFRQLGRMEEAIKDYSKAIALDPGMAKAYNNRGTAYSHTENWQKAIRDFDQALLLEPGKLNFLNNRANAYNGKGDNQKALADVNLAIRLDPTYIQAHYTRAVIYYSMGSKAAALRGINKVIELGGKVDPRFEQAVHQLGE